MSLTLVFFDGFDTLTVSQDPRKWANVSASSHATGRVSGNAAILDSSSSAYFYETLSFSAGATWCVAFALSLKSVSGGDEFLQIKDGASNIHLSLRVNSSRQLALYRGDGTLLNTGSTSLANDTWYSVQIKFTIHDSTGNYNVLVNSVSEFSATNVDTRNSGNATVDRFRFIQANGTNLQFRIDDFVCGTSSDTSNTTDLIGDVHVYVSAPNAVGDTTGWTPDSGSNYSRVNETPADDDTSFVYTAGVSNDDLYNFTDLSITGTILGVGLQLVHRDEASGARTIKGLCKSGTVTEQGPTISPSTSYGVTQIIIQNDPNTGVAWTQSNLNSAQFGVRLKT